MSKKIGFLSLGYWTDSPGSQVRSAADSLLQFVELAVAAENLGADGAYLIKELAADQAIAAADTLLMTIPRTLDVDYNARVIESVLKYVAPKLGWR